jgi:CHAT domain
MGLRRLGRDYWRTFIRLVGEDLILPTVALAGVVAVFVEHGWPSALALATTSLNIQLLLLRRRPRLFYQIFAIVWSVDQQPAMRLTLWSWALGLSASGLLLAIPPALPRCSLPFERGSVEWKSSSRLARARFRRSKWAVLTSRTIRAQAGEQILFAIAASELGQYQRALDALEGCRESLLVPPIRTRILLDIGDLKSATEELGAVDRQYSKYNRSASLLQGARASFLGGDLARSEQMLTEFRATSGTSLGDQLAAISLLGQLHIASGGEVQDGEEIDAVLKGSRWFRRQFSASAVFLRKGEDHASRLLDERVQQRVGHFIECQSWPLVEFIMSPRSRVENEIDELIEMSELLRRIGRFDSAMRIDLAVSRHLLDRDEADRAVKVLGDGLGLMQSIRHKFTDPLARRLWLSKHHELGSTLLNIAFEINDHRTGLEVIETFRLQQLIADSPKSAHSVFVQGQSIVPGDPMQMQFEHSIEAARSQLPGERNCWLTYLELGDHLWIGWQGPSDQVRVERVPLNQGSQLAGLLDALIEHLPIPVSGESEAQRSYRSSRSGLFRKSHSFEALLVELTAQLFPPALQSLLIDGVAIEHLGLSPTARLAHIPWAYLPIGPVHLGLRVVEVTTVVLCPSTSSLCRPITTKESVADDGWRIGLVVLDPVESAELDPLPRARGLAEFIERYSGTPTVLGGPWFSGPSATKSAINEGLSAASGSVAVFACHARSSDGYGESGMIVAGTNGGPDIFTFREISELELPTIRKVILSGCDTGALRSSTFGEWSGLAPAFIEAGATEVSVSLFPVLDAGAERLETSVLEGLAAGYRITESIRALQLGGLHAWEADSKCSALDSPFSWASAIVVAGRTRIRNSPSVMLIEADDALVHAMSEGWCRRYSRDGYATAGELVFGSLCDRRNLGPVMLMAVFGWATVFPRRRGHRSLLEMGTEALRHGPITSYGRQQLTLSNVVSAYRARRPVRFAIIARLTHQSAGFLDREKRVVSEVDAETLDFITNSFGLDEAQLVPRPSVRLKPSDRPGIRSKVKGNDSNASRWGALVVALALVGGVVAFGAFLFDYTNLKTRFESRANFARPATALWLAGDARGAALRARGLLKERPNSIDAELVDACGSWSIGHFDHGLVAYQLAVFRGARPISDLRIPKGCVFRDPREIGFNVARDPRGRSVLIVKPQTDDRVGRDLAAVVLDQWSSDLGPEGYYAQICLADRYGFEQYAAMLMTITFGELEGKAKDHRVRGMSKECLGSIGKSYRMKKGNTFDTFFPADQAQRNSLAVGSTDPCKDLDQPFKVCNQRIK